MKTASNIAKKYQGCANQIGRSPKNKFRSVPPVIDATIAINKIPP
jgi:hypothetical protein